jgi:hypothetical protein
MGKVCFITRPDPGLSWYSAPRRATTFEQEFRQRVLNPLLDATLERPGAEYRIKTNLRKFCNRRFRHFECEIYLLQPGLEHLELHPGNRLDVFCIKRVEDDDLIDPIQELGKEVVLQLVLGPAPNTRE